MKSKPAHLTEEYAAQWEDRCMAEAYPCRPPYPEGVFDILEELADGGPVLDIGCGTGDLARPLAVRGLRVDGVDRSLEMLRVGRRSVGGDAVRWMVGRAEQPPVRGPYGVVTAGECMHWLDWERVFAPLRRLAPRLALVNREREPEPWAEELQVLIREHSTNRCYEPYDLCQELASRGLFVALGIEQTGPVSFAQPVEEYIECIHSRNGFSRARMTRASAAEFDEALRDLLAPFAPDGRVVVRLSGIVRWA